jgi:hypothetical protein
MTTSLNVRVFFYGSYMDLNILKDFDCVPEQWEVARLYGCDIVIRPRANLIRSDRTCVYGIVAAVTHDELDRLYARIQRDFGQTYLPKPVLAETLNGTWVPSLTYIAASMEAETAAHDYIERMVRPARELNFPPWYIERLESFRS